MSTIRSKSKRVRRLYDTTSVWMSHNRIRGNYHMVASASAQREVQLGDLWQHGMRLGALKCCLLASRFLGKYTVRNIHSGRLLRTIERSHIKMDASFTGEDLRRIFIEFFQNKYQHTFVRSSSVVPHDDPTLLFTNAGMNQVCCKFENGTALP